MAAKTKEKAEALVEKFKPNSYSNTSWDSDLFEKILQRNSVKNAILCVKEIMEAIGDINYLEQQSLDREYIFWDEVLTELNKM